MCELEKRKREYLEEDWKQILYLYTEFSEEQFYQMLDIMNIKEPYQIECDNELIYVNDYTIEFMCGGYINVRKVDSDFDYYALYEYDDDYKKLDIRLNKKRLEKDRTIIEMKADVDYIQIKFHLYVLDTVSIDLSNTQDSTEYLNQNSLLFNIDLEKISKNIKIEDDVKIIFNTLLDNINKEEWFKKDKRIAIKKNWRRKDKEQYLSAINSEVGYLQYEKDGILIGLSQNTDWSLEYPDKTIEFGNDKYSVCFKIEDKTLANQIDIEKEISEAEELVKKLREEEFKINN